MEKLERDSSGGSALDEQISDLRSAIERMNSVLDYLLRLRSITGGGPFTPAIRSDKYARGRVEEHVIPWLMKNGPATVRQIYEELIVGGRVLSPNLNRAMGHIRTSLKQLENNGKARELEDGRWDVTR